MRNTGLCKGGGGLALYCEKGQTNGFFFRRDYGGIVV